MLSNELRQDYLRLLNKFKVISKREKIKEGIDDDFIEMINFSKRTGKMAKDVDTEQIVTDVITNNRKREINVYLPESLTNSYGVQNDIYKAILNLKDIQSNTIGFFSDNDNFLVNLGPFKDDEYIEYLFMLTMKLFMLCPREKWSTLDKIIIVSTYTNNAKLALKNLQDFYKEEQSWTDFAKKVHKLRWALYNKFNFPTLPKILKENNLSYPKPQKLKQDFTTFEMCTALVHFLSLHRSPLPINIDNEKCYRISYIANESLCISLCPDTKHREERQLIRFNLKDIDLPVFYILRDYINVENCTTYFNVILDITDDLVKDLVKDDLRNIFSKYATINDSGESWNVVMKDKKIKRKIGEVE